MGLLDFFKSGPSKNAILGQVRKAKEIYAQPEYRRMAMEKLLKWGTDESIRGLLERFSVVVQSPHWDEDEKRWLMEELVKLDSKALPILKEFIMNKNEVNYALMAYRKIIKDDHQYKDLLVEALKHRPPSDHRSVMGKQEIIASLSEFEPDYYRAIILPYLFDHSDDVQCAVIDALAKSNDFEVKEELIKLLSSEEHSARVLRAVAQLISQQGIAMEPNTELADAVREDFTIKDSKLVPIHH